MFINVGTKKIISILSGKIPNRNLLIQANLNDYCNEMNSEGYRSDSFETNPDIGVISIGCSDVFGWNLSKKDRFSDIFCNSLAQTTGKKVANWNLGLVGGSNDYIGRTMIASLQQLHPHIVLVCFTRIGRREYFDIDGNYINYLPAHKSPDCGAYNHLNALASYNQDILNFYINYKLVESLTTLSNSKLLFSLSLNTQNKPLGIKDVLKLVDQNKYVGYFNWTDLTSDKNHPGIESNKIMAELFYNKYLDSL